jgi:hypothetical protein
MMPQALATFDRAEIADEREVAAAHANDPYASEYPFYEGKHPSLQQSAPADDAPRLNFVNCCGVAEVHRSEVL